MKIALYPFMILAAIGFLASLGFHFLALAGVPIPGAKTVWLLHFGIFVVWLPTIVVLRNNFHVPGSRDSWRRALAGCPPWMRVVVYIAFGYAFINFALFFFGTLGQPKPTSDVPPNVVRGFSGHWMFFYAAAFAALFSAVHSRHPPRTRICPNGHAVSPAATHCPECGTKLGDDRRKVVEHVRSRG